MKAIYGGECSSDYITETPTINPQDLINSGISDENHTMVISNNDGAKGVLVDVPGLIIGIESDDDNFHFLYTLSDLVQLVLNLKNLCTINLTISFRCSQVNLYVFQRCNPSYLKAV